MASQEIGVFYSPDELFATLHRLIPPIARWTEQAGTCSAIGPGMLGPQWALPSDGRQSAAFTRQEFCNRMSISLY